jgi:hypothetical protein
MSSGTRSLRLTLGLFAWALAGASTARAADRFEAPDAGAVFGSGAAVQVGWRLSGTPGPGLREMELVLSLDGGRTYPIRVTRDLDPATRSLAWRVPAFPTRHARLALRTGDGQEPHAENIRLVSEEFAIEIDAASALEPAQSVRGEWRVREALETGSTDAPLSPPALGEQGSAFRSVPELPDAAGPRKRPSATVSAACQAAIVKLAPESPALPTPSDFPRTLIDTPRRE